MFTCASQGGMLQSDNAGKHYATLLLSKQSGSIDKLITESSAKPGRFLAVLLVTKLGWKGSALHLHDKDISS